MPSSIFPVWKMALFLCSHIPKIPYTLFLWPCSLKNGLVWTTWGNKISQGVRGLGYMLEFPRFFSSQASRFNPKKSWLSSSIPKSLHMDFSTLQSLRVWRMDSGLPPHNSQVGSRFNPCEPRTSFVGTLRWVHNQRKNFILGDVLAFHTHWWGLVSRFKMLNPLAMSRQIWGRRNHPLRRPRLECPPSLGLQQQGCL